MKFTKTTIATLILLVPIGYLSYELTMSIVTPIVQNEKIRTIESEVIAKLKVIRDLQIYYNTSKGKYAKTFEELEKFVKTGEFWNINKKEIDMGENKKPKIIIDTLGKVAVKDSLATLLKNVDVSKLAAIPGSTKTFSINAGTIETGNVTVPVFEVIDTDPVNPKRIKEKKILKVGSMKEATTAGTWE